MKEVKYCDGCPALKLVVYRNWHTDWKCLRLNKMLKYDSELEKCKRPKSCPSNKEVV